MIYLENYGVCDACGFDRERNTKDQCDLCESYEQGRGELTDKLKVAEDALRNLQARIFRDGGHRTYKLGGPIAALEETDRAVVKLLGQHDALVECVKILTRMQCYVSGVGNSDKKPVANALMNAKHALKEDGVVTGKYTEEAVILGAGPTSDGDFELRIKPPRETMLYIAGAAMQLFKEDGGVNFVEYTIEHDTEPPVTLTIQALNGMSPATLLKEAEAKLAKRDEVIRTYEETGKDLAESLRIREAQVNKFIEAIDFYAYEPEQYSSGKSVAEHLNRVLELSK